MVMLAIVLALAVALLILARAARRRVSADLPTDDEVVRAIATVPMHFFTPRSAKNAKVRIGTQILVAKKWTVTPKSDKLDVSNFEGGGFYEFIGGLVQADVEIEFDMDAAAVNATGNNYDIPNIQPGNNNTAVVKLFLNDTTSPFWSFPNFFIETMPNTADVKQTQQGRLTGSGSGQFLYPTGTF